MKTVVSTDQKGYEAPLFLDDKPKWTDERLMGGAGDHISTKYHDRETTLKILNGLCADPFFRAEEVRSSRYATIPDCAAPAGAQAAPGSNLGAAARPIKPSGSPDFRKPLDSPYKKRTYVIGKESPHQPSLRNPSTPREVSRPSSLRQKPFRGRRRRR